MIVEAVHIYYIGCTPHMPEGRPRYECLIDISRGLYSSHPPHNNNNMACSNIHSRRQWTTTTLIKCINCTVSLQSRPVQSGPGPTSNPEHYNTVSEKASVRPLVTIGSPCWCCAVWSVIINVQRWNYYDCCFAAILNPPPSIHPSIHSH